MILPRHLAKPYLKVKMTQIPTLFQPNGNQVEFPSLPPGITNYLDFRFPYCFMPEPKATS